MSGPVPLERPEHCPGAYVMHFYCKYDNPAHPRPWEAYMEEAYQVESRTAAIRQMRDRGWLHHANNTATCPMCAAALRARITQEKSNG